MPKIDLTKVKPGDKVTIEVTAVEFAGNLVFYLGIDNYDMRLLDPDCKNWFGKANFTIVGHTPAPHVWKVGDRFKFTDRVEERTIVFIDEESVLFTAPRGSRNHFARGTWEKNLYRIQLIE